MNLHWFANIIVHHPCLILSAVAVFSSTCLIIPFTLKNKSFPDFSDPQLGFSTRGTIISKRLVAWENLIQSTKPSGQFAINPKDFLVEKNESLSFGRVILRPSDKKQRKRKKMKSHQSKFPALDDNRTDTDSYKRWKFVSEMLNMHFPKQFSEKTAEIDGFLCGYPDDRYAHLVLKSKENENLFTLKSLQALCRIEHEIIDNEYYKSLCIVNPTASKCCKPWSLVNYIAVSHSKASCLAITEEDIKSTLSLLVNCSQYFHNLHLTPDCVESGECEAPAECIRHDLVYNVLNFLTSISFLPPNNTNELILTETMIFLPVACSTATLPYYHYLEDIKLEYEGISVVAMEFGIKSALFDEYLLKEMWLIVFGVLFVIFCIWLYTKSLFLTIMTIIAIIFSLGISYFMYTLVFELTFFPFINLLAVIVAIGIGADDVFVFCKIWYTVKLEEHNSIVHIMSETCRHGFFAMFVTSLTTSIAFLSSFSSSVTAIRCFSVFAGTAVLTNFLLMLTWFPACLIIWERSCWSGVNVVKSCLMACLQRWCCCKIIKPQWNWSEIIWPPWTRLQRIWDAKERFLLNNVIKFKYVWLISLSTLTVLSIVVVVYYPKLQLPTSKEFQLFHSNHPFEQYDFVYKNHFWFKRAQKNTDMSNYNLPLRFVWGVLPEDNGNYLDPVNFGRLKLDPTFDITNSDSQEWLLEFCMNLKRQPFCEPAFGPIYPNCFIETFKKSMERPCINPFSLRDHSPCCKTSTFPFNSSVFTKCIVEEMTEIFETPSQYLIPGMAGPKFDKDQFPTIKAIIIEYDSNYSYSMSFKNMDEFFTIIENWMTEQLKTAPATMKNGWFVSDLNFYDLQRELSNNTIVAITISMALSISILFLATLNVLTSLYAIVTITCSIFVTIAMLIVMGWKLNILESITISTTIGLTVDYTLHYAINYGMCPINLTQDRTVITKYALSNVAGPVLMAALTTSAAGAFMLFSSVLPYIQIGIFLITVMSISWFYATFFMGSLLAAIGPQNRFCQFSYNNLICFNSDRVKKSLNKKSYQIKSSLSSDAHEMDTLTKSNRSRIRLEPVPGTSKSFDAESLSCVNVHNANIAAIPSTSGVGRVNDYSQGVCVYTCSINNINVNNVFTDQSPSATSEITIITADEN